MPYITPEIKKALLNLIENEGSASELSRKTGISHSNSASIFQGNLANKSGKLESDSPLTITIFTGNRTRQSKK